ncbi:MAG: hypothetical protein JNN11_05465 [Candidatus Doudnabacteria bacterium]|nr:hypothetical protein [Candidatus Doudnabacteria bacterium]
MDWQTYGHEQVKKILNLQLKSGVFPHAYLFVGPQGLGKKMLAMEMAGKVLDSIDPGKHPDFLFYDSKNGNLESIRDFLEKLSYKPFVGKYKLAVIDSAESLNMQSQNAILKTLEEPSPSTVIFIISARPLLPTVLSRCQLFNFNRFSQNQVNKFCSVKNIKTENIDLAEIFGCPGGLGVEVQKADSFAWGEWKAMPKAQRLFKILELAEKDNEALAESLYKFFKQEILSLKSYPENYKIVLSLGEAHNNLKKNLNKKLILQKLALSF